MSHNPYLGGRNPVRGHKKLGHSLSSLAREFQIVFRFALAVRKSVKNDTSRWISSKSFVPPPGGQPGLPHPPQGR